LCRPCFKGHPQEMSMAGFVAAFGLMACGAVASSAGTASLEITSAGRAAADAEVPSLVRKELAKPHRHKHSQADTSMLDISNASGVESEHPPSTLPYEFLEEEKKGACNTHFEFHGHISNEECAKRCYNTNGCTRFSAGGCDFGCRVSHSNKNTRASADGSTPEVPPDGQCPTSHVGEAAGCILYELAFFHAVQEPGYCNEHYEMKLSAQNKAECAHACKNTPGCKRFSGEPNCMRGCRVSKCDSNKHTAECPADKQCTLSEDEGCAVYELTR